MRGQLSICGRHDTILKYRGADPGFLDRGSNLQRGVDLLIVDDNLYFF